MTTSAWIMMLVTWTVIISVASRFFIKVLRAPKLHRDDDQRPLILAKDA